MQCFVNALSASKTDSAAAHDGPRVHHDAAERHELSLLERLERHRDFHFRRTAHGG